MVYFSLIWLWTSFLNLKFRKVLVMLTNCWVATNKVITCYYHHRPAARRCSSLRTRVGQDPGKRSRRSSQQPLRTTLRSNVCFWFWSVALCSHDFLPRVRDQLILSKSELRLGAFVRCPVFASDIRLLSSTASFSAANWFSQQPTHASKHNGHPVPHK